MYNVGVGIMYIIMGFALNKLIPKLNGRTTKQTRRMGKMMFYMGIVIFSGSFFAFIPSVGTRVSIYILGIAALATGICALKETREFQDRVQYGVDYLLEAIRKEDKEKFEWGYSRYPDILCTEDHPEIFERLAEKGILEEWVKDKKHLFNETVKKHYTHYRLKSLFKRSP